MSPVKDVLEKLRAERNEAAREAEINVQKKKDELERKRAENLSLFKKFAQETGLMQSLNELIEEEGLSAAEINVSEIHGVDDMSDLRVTLTWKEGFSRSEHEHRKTGTLGRELDIKDIHDTLNVITSKDTGHYFLTIRWRKPSTVWVSGEKEGVATAIEDPAGGDLDISIARAYMNPAWRSDSVVIYSS